MVDRWTERGIDRELNNVSDPEGYWQVMVADWKAQISMKITCFVAFILMAGKYKKKRYKSKCRKREGGIKNMNIFRKGT